LPTAIPMHYKKHQTPRNARLAQTVGEYVCQTHIPSNTKLSKSKIAPSVRNSHSLEACSIMPLSCLILHSASVGFSGSIRRAPRSTRR